MADYKIAVLGIVDSEFAKKMITFAHFKFVKDREMLKPTADLDLMLDEYKKRVLEKKGE